MDCCFTFHGVGQGLFYTATLEKNRKRILDFVYDCGSENKSYLNLAIQSYCNSFQSEGKTEIDFLVLSHIHDDHINGLPLLLKSVSPHKIYLPYFDVKTYMDVFKACLFCNGVLPQSDEYGLIIEWYINPPESVQFVGQNDVAFCTNNWEFLFFNVGIDLPQIKLLQKEIQLLLHRTSTVNIEEYVNKHKDIKELKDIFIAIFGKRKINLTSLVLLHYSTDGEREQTLLTGDVVFDKNLEKRILKNISETRNLILQISHHGAKNEWMKIPLCIKNMATSMVIPFGLGNKYRHPSSYCIDEIYSKCSRSNLFCVYQNNRYSGRIS